MKASFYFVLWILIYPLLGLLNNDFINSNSFLFALFVVWGLSWLINRSIPQIIRYERVTSQYPMLEDVYTSNVKGFAGKLAVASRIEIVTAIYFAVATAAIIFDFVKNFDNWLELIIFGLFAYSVFSHSNRLVKASRDLKMNPTPEECMNIADNIFAMDYASYYNRRQTRTYAEMYLPRPKGMTAFRVISILFALGAAILGIVFIVMSIISMLNYPAFIAGTFGSMMILYGSLAAYYGIRDTVQSVQSFRKKI